MLVALEWIFDSNLRTVLVAGFEIPQPDGLPSESADDCWKIWDGISIQARGHDGTSAILVTNLPNRLPRTQHGVV